MRHHANALHAKEPVWTRHRLVEVYPDPRYEPMAAAVSVDAACRWLRKSPMTLYAWRLTGKMPQPDRRDGCALYWSKSVLDQWLTYQRASIPKPLPPPVRLA